MQFPVPQFTEVEDRIIGGLSFKQFGIIFVAGVFTFAIYSMTKSLFATIVAAIFLGLPALALAFGKLNGRPLYASAGSFVGFLFGAKKYVFHKQALEEKPAPTVVVHEAPAPKNPKQTAIKIKELNYLLQQQASEEGTLLERIKQNKSINNPS